MCLFHFITVRIRRNTQEIVQIQGAGFHPVIPAADHFTAMLGLVGDGGFRKRNASQKEEQCQRLPVIFLTDSQVVTNLRV